MSKKGLCVGVVGATGAVGETALEILTDADQMAGVEISELKAFASKSSAGKILNHGGQKIPVEVLDAESGRACDVIFFATGGDISETHIPALAAQGVLCIDKSSAFRMNPEVPLVVPEVNGHLLEGDALVNQPIVANPNCCSAPLTVALGPLQKSFGLKRLIVSTYQSVTGAGKQAVDVLLDETRGFLEKEDLAPTESSSVFPKPIAFNVFPFVASIDQEGHTDEEAKIIQETRKILDLPDLPVAATSVRVPTFVTHGEAVTVELERATTAQELAVALEKTSGLCVGDPAATVDRDPDTPEPSLSERGNHFPTPREAHGKDPVFVGRIREVGAFPQGTGFSFWVVSDNLRKGAALNGVHILKHAARVGLLEKLRAHRAR